MTLSDPTEELVEKVARALAKCRSCHRKSMYAQYGAVWANLVPAEPTDEQYARAAISAMQAEGVRDDGA
jgi:hypothetical protein